MVPQGCVLSFQAEEVESMHGNYFSLGTLVQSNPTASPPLPMLLSPHPLTHTPLSLLVYATIRTVSGTCW